MYTGENTGDYANSPVFDLKIDVRCTILICDLTFFVEYAYRRQTVTICRF